MTIRVPPVIRTSASLVIANVDTVAPRAENPGSAAAQSQLKNTVPAAPRDRQGASRLLAGCFCMPGPMSPTTKTARSIAAERAANLDGAIDQWGKTQSDAVDAAHKIKNLLRENGSSKLFSNARATKTLSLQGHNLTSIPIQLCQAHKLETLDLTRNKLTNLPAEIAGFSKLKQLILKGNSLANLPVEIAQVDTLQDLNLSHNYLSSFPAEMGASKTLKSLDLSQNQLASFPAEMGKAIKLTDLDLKGNHLRDLPDEIGNLSNLRHLDISHNRFRTVPRALLKLPSTTEIDLRRNPLPEQEILLVRAAILERRAAGLMPPQILLPRLAAEGGEFYGKDANAHQSAVISAFKQRLDSVARQFPHCLTGDVATQHAELKAIEARLTHALDTHEANYAPDPKTLLHAREIASTMFKKGHSEDPANYNEFKYSSGHVLAYTFLSLEAQWDQTPKSDIAQAHRNGMQGLIAALDSGSGGCDTRLSEEVMQLIGLPLSDYAQANPEVSGIEPPPVTDEEARDLIMIEAKRILGDLIDRNPNLDITSQPAIWRQILVKRIQTEQPTLPPESLSKTIAQILSMWETFHDLVEEQRANAASADK